MSSVNVSEAIIPDGSYRQTVKNVQVLLQGQAQKQNGSWVDASLDITYLASPDVENIDGTLRDTGRQASRSGFVPAAATRGAAGTWPCS